MIEKDGIEPLIGQNGSNGFIKHGNGAANGASNGFLSSPTPPRKLSRNVSGLFLVGTGFLLLYYWYGRSSETIDFSRYYQLTSSGRSDQCRIPRPDPWDPTIQKYIEAPKPLVCKKLQSELTYMDSAGWLHFNASAAQADGYSSSLNCNYRCFDKELGKDDVTLRFQEWNELKGRARPDCEFLEVSCSRAFPTISVYSNLHNQIIPLKTPPPKPQKDSPPSVLLFVLDSVSHSNAIRNLPKLLRVLKEEYGAVTLDGYAKVGDNSFPNAAAFLTGKRVLVAGYPSELQEDMSKDFFDDWPIVWKDFQRKGYRTYYAEDYPDYNLFKYLSNGFRGKPVDHYFRPFWVQLWSTFLHKRSSHLCFANAPKHALQLNYLREFLLKYDKASSFGLNWLTELGHDWLNQVGTADEFLADFFTAAKPYLNDTFLFVFSDHGHRFDRIRESVIGRIEERMPLFTVSLPEWARSRYPELVQNLRNNSETLTSPFDLYVTMRDILESGRGWEGLGAQKNWSGVAPRGLSLFRPIPRQRSCADAGITEDFCVCQHETPVNVTEPTIVRSAEVVVKHINALLEGEGGRCAKLRLAEIRNAQTFLPNHNMIEDKEVSIFYGGSNPTGFYVNYRVTIETQPGGAVFEGTLRNSVKDDVLSVIGDVNRINKYGNTSVCVNSALLRKFCYCLHPP